MISYVAIALILLAAVAALLFVLPPLFVRRARGDLDRRRRKQNAAEQKWTDRPR